mgnify:CR=1 FL=1
MFDNNFTIIPKSLDAYSARMKSIAQNLSNYNTPNYKRKVVNFENELQRALDNGSEGDIKLKTSNENHIANVPNLSDVSYNTTIDNTKSDRNDGNNVDEDVEVNNLIQTNLKYTTLSRLMTYKINNYNTAIKNR